MKLKLNLPPVKYKNILPGYVFTNAKASKLFVMTGNPDPSFTNANRAVQLFSDPTDDVYDKFDAMSISAIFEMNFFLVSFQGKIDEIT